MDFYATGIERLISYYKNMLIVMAPTLINKDVFDSSYIDLEFMV